MCTASHKPEGVHGAKLVREGALALSGDAGIQDVRQRIEEGLGDAPGGGRVEQVDVADAFRERALSAIEPNVAMKDLTLVVDGGNGMAGPMVGPLFDRLGVSYVPTYWVPDGEFPDHEPNPLLEENRRFILDKVAEMNADLGIAWDGDADRCFFIDDTRRFVDGDFLTALLAEALLRKRPGATILYDVRASRAVADTVNAAGGTPLINRVGHAFFKARMRETGAIFAGEVSATTTSPTSTTPTRARCGAPHARVAVGRRRQAQRPARAIPLEVLHLRRDQLRGRDQEAKMRKLEERYSDAEISHLDGVSVDYPDWHFNVRPSNTEPLLRLCLESLVSREDMERRRDEVLALIRS